MYGGLVETVGHVESIVTANQCKTFVISAPSVLSDCHIGDSLSVNGVCLTVTAFDATTFQVTAVPETLRLTNLDLLTEGAPVNIERCITANQRIGGHFIQGHVDTMIKILSIDHEGDAWLVKFSLPEPMKNYIVKKGFVTLDGMSITVVDVGADWFSVTFIPHTREATIVQNYKVGTAVNLEVDMLAKLVAKYVESFLRSKT